MKVRITNMPVRIDGKRYLPGAEIEVTKELYKTMKSNCIILEEQQEDEEEIEDNEEVEKEELTEDQKIMQSKEYKAISKDDIMLKLAEDNIEFDPNKGKLDLFKMLGSD